MVYADSAEKFLKGAAFRPDRHTLAAIEQDFEHRKAGALHWRVQMALAYAPFQKRLRRIIRRHNRMQHGVTHVMRKDGLIEARPRVYNPRFPLRGLLMLFGAAFFFKGFILASLGEGVYDARVGQLAEGTLVEQAGAWVMQADAITLFVAGALKGFGL